MKKGASLTVHALGSAYGVTKPIYDCFVKFNVDIDRFIDEVNKLDTYYIYLKNYEYVSSALSFSCHGITLEQTFLDMGFIEKDGYDLYFTDTSLSNLGLLRDYEGLEAWYENTHSKEIDNWDGGGLIAYLHAVYRGEERAGQLFYSDMIPHDFAMKHFKEDDTEERKAFYKEKLKEIL